MLNVACFRAAEPWWLTCSVDWLIRQPITRRPALRLLNVIGTWVSGIPAKNLDHMIAVLQNATGITFDLVKLYLSWHNHYPAIIFLHFCHWDLRQGRIVI